MLVQLQGREVWYLQLNEAVSKRLVELMQVHLLLLKLLHHLNLHHLKHSLLLQ